MSAGCAGGCLYGMVRADHSPIACNATQSTQAGANGVISGHALTHKMSCHGAKNAGFLLSGRSIIEIDLCFFALAAAEFLQQFDQLHFIVHRFQRKARDFGYQVVAVYHIWHWFSF
jgi:hypothetical protein